MTTNEWPWPSDPSESSSIRRPISIEAISILLISTSSIHLIDSTTSRVPKPIRQTKINLQSTKISNQLKNSMRVTTTLICELLTLSECYDIPDIKLVAAQLRILWIIKYLRCLRLIKIRKNLLLSFKINLRQIFVILEFRQIH